MMENLIAAHEAARNSVVSCEDIVAIAANLIMKNSNMGYSSVKVYIEDLVGSEAIDSLYVNNLIQNLTQALMSKGYDVSNYYYDEKDPKRLFIIISWNNEINKIYTNRLYKTGNMDMISFEEAMKNYQGFNDHIPQYQYVSR